MTWVQGSHEQTHRAQDRDRLTGREAPSTTHAPAAPASALRSLATLRPARLLLDHHIALLSKPLLSFDTGRLRKPMVPAVPRLNARPASCYLHLHVPRHTPASTTSYTILLSSASLRYPSSSRKSFPCSVRASLLRRIRGRRIRFFALLLSISCLWDLELRSGENIWGLAGWVARWCFWGCISRLWGCW